MSRNISTPDKTLVEKWRVFITIIIAITANKDFVYLSVIYLSGTLFLFF
jgi:hypothetical protein